MSSPEEHGTAAAAPARTPSHAGLAHRRARRVWLGAGAGAALAAGVGAALWREQHRQPELPEETRSLWAARFAQPGKTEELVMARFLGQPLVLNFWATWCPPCVKEMPELDRFGRDFASRGWQLAGLALDNEAAVQQFLQRVPVRFAIGLAGFAGSEIGRSLGNLRGLLPFTVVFNRDGAIAQRKLGETSYDELAAWAKLLG
jgi:thiol-disulfide isomerase/thioredoxin